MNLFLSPDPLLSRRHLFLVLLLLVVLQLGMAAASTVAHAQSDTPPSITNVEIVTPSVARSEKFEMNFDVTTVSNYVNLPYDAEPPAGLAPGMGVSVDALFSSDNWQTTIVQPAFYYQPYQYQSIQGKDHLIPDGAPHWKVRFTPQATGDWQVRLRARDSGGETMFPVDAALDFQVYEPGSERYQGLRVNPYTRHGFMRVSEHDPRYFEFQDGTPFFGLGYNAGSESVATVQERYRQWQQNGIEFARVWMSGMGINASQWTPYSYPEQPNNFSLPTTLFGNRELLGDAALSFWLRPPFTCLFTDFWQGGIPVQPNTVYSLTVTAKLVDIKPRANAGDAGFVVVRGGWMNRTCDNLKNKPLLPVGVGSTDWYTATTTIKTGANENFLNYLYLALKNVESGEAFVDEIRLVAQDDPAGVNVLHDPRADSHLHYDEMNAARWDLLIEQAEEHGISLKIVTDEKNEWIRNVLSANGKLTNFDNNNFYAAPNTEVRWLHEAWWRYLIARWGYSTAIHSFEFINEGDPYSANHYNAADAMARYFDEHDPSQHMVTTSLWHSFPNSEFWSNPKYGALDYADLHAYITTGWGNTAAFIKPKFIESRPEYRYQGMNTLHLAASANVRESVAPRGIALREPGEWTIRYWMKQENFKAKCGFGEGGSSVHVYWSLDGGAQQGAVPENSDGKNFLCTSPDGTFDWSEFNTRTDRDGKPIPLEHRLVISGTLPHELGIGISNQGGVSGDAWIANIELVSPSGVRVPVLGTFDTTRFDDDPAWFTAAYSLLWGGSSPTGAHMPLIRGETGINSSDLPNGYPEMNQDTEGVWLHQFVWGQINPGGMYDLWWAGKVSIEDNTANGRPGDLYRVFLPYANFMADIPINKGAYRDVEATADNTQIRVWGQRDDTNGRAHLWIQNKGFTWRRVIAGEAIEPVNGTILVPNLPAGLYRIEWWDTHRSRDQILHTQEISVENQLKLQLAEPLTSDIAVKIWRIGDAEYPFRIVF